MAYHQNGGNRGNSGNGFGVILEAAPPTPGGNSGNSGNGGNIFHKPFSSKFIDRKKRTSAFTYLLL